MRSLGRSSCTTRPVNSSCSQRTANDSCSTKTNCSQTMNQTNQSIMLAGLADTNRCHSSPRLCAPFHAGCCNTTCVATMSAPVVLANSAPAAASAATPLLNVAGGGSSAQVVTSTIAARAVPVPAQMPPHLSQGTGGDYQVQCMLGGRAWEGYQVANMHTTRPTSAFCLKSLAWCTCAESRSSCDPKSWRKARRWCGGSGVHEERSYCLHTKHCHPRS